MSVDQDIKTALQGICEHREEFHRLFKSELRHTNFLAQKYKDQGSYEAHTRVGMMYNKFKYMLSLCDDKYIDQ